MLRTDGQSDQYMDFATMWRVLDNLLHVFFNINAPFGSDYFVLLSQHGLGGGDYYIAIPPLFAKGGGMNLLYSHFPAYPGKGEIWLYSHFSGGGGGNGYGEKLLYNTGPLL